MSGLSVAINNAITGLNAGQAGLAVTSQNVANANTEGYSRKLANQSNVVIAGVPNGVEIETITRLTNDFLKSEFIGATSEFKRSEAVAEFFDLMQNTFGSPGSNTSFADDFSDLVSAFEALSNNPENAGLRFDAVAKAEALADNIQTAANSVQSLRFEADQQINASVDLINNALIEIDKVNIEIKRSQAVGGSTADLEDKRDLFIRQVSAEIDVSTFVRGDGRIAVLTGRGQTLVDDRAHAIDYTPASIVSAATSFGEMRIFATDSDGNAFGVGEQIVSSGTSAAVTTTIESGRLAGLLQSRDTELAQLASTLDTLATTIRDQVNNVHNLGSGFPPPNSLTGSQTVAAGDAFQATGTVRIAVTDGSGTIVDVHDLDLTALGASTINGLVTDIGTGLAGNATIAVINGNLQITATDSANGIVINGSGTAETTTGRNFSHHFGLNDFFEGTNSTDLAVRANIKADPSQVSTGELSTTAAIGETGISVGDNRTVQDLSALGSAFVTFSSVGGLPAMSASIGDFAGAIVGLNSARSAASEEVREQRQFVLENIDNRFTSATGVNLDEELAEMVLFQNAFTMSARMLSIASEMFDTLVNLQA